MESRVWLDRGFRDDWMPRTPIQSVSSESSMYLSCDPPARVSGVQEEFKESKETIHELDPKSDGVQSEFKTLLRTRREVDWGQPIIDKSCISGCMHFGTLFYINSLWGLGPHRVSLMNAVSEDVAIEKADLAGIHIVRVEADGDTAVSLEDRISASVNHRRLGARQIQLTSIAGSIGAALFVAIGSGVVNGPIALLVGFLFWSTVIYSVAQCRKLLWCALLTCRARGRDQIPL